MIRVAERCLVLGQEIETGGVGGGLGSAGEAYVIYGEILAPTATVTLTPTPTITPTPVPVGGIALDPNVGAPALESSDRSGGAQLYLIGAVAAGALVVLLGSGAAWYATRLR